MIDISEIVSFLSCPDDGSQLEIHSNALRCTSCNREFPVKNNFLDIRPKKSVTVNEDGSAESVYHEYYENLTTTCKPGNKIGTFGIISKSIPPGFVSETTFYLQKHMKKSDIVCDVGAGSGDYSINLASKCRIMFHCDLDMDGLVLSQEKARSLGLDNIFFIMCDYFKLPFKPRIIDHTYAIDVIERGEKHDSMLLSEIARITKKDGHVLFDCHAKERASFTHVTSSELKTYYKNEISELAKEFSLFISCIVGTGFLPQIRIWSSGEYKILNGLAKIMKFPPARWLFVCNVT